MSLDPAKWARDYTTGNESVDLQHQYFAKLINRICADLHASNDTKYKKRLLDELVKYARFHFTSEENIAYSLGLEGLGRHHERHHELLDEIDTHIDDLLIGKYSTDDFVNFLVEWFYGHTVYEDTRFFLGDKNS